jgi:hypothetical protein
MLTCENLDGFVEQLCDLTRMMNGADRIREAGELLKLVESVPQRFIMQWRAAETADLHYLLGRSLRSIAAAEGVSFQAVSQWLQNHGPHFYLVIHPGPPGDELAYTAQRIAVEGDKQTQTKIKRYQAAGRRVVPATLNAIDLDRPDELAEGVDLAQLWQRTGAWEELQKPA